jgi:ABC-type polysaccharide/polyol phosphate transport system ATPase subunit
MASVIFENVSLQYPVYDARHLSLRTKLVSIATGGLLKKVGSAPIVEALKDVSVDIQQGDSIGLTGHNGAGKSTFLRVVAGIYKPTSGSVSVSGSIASVFDLGAGFDPELDGKQNIINLCLLRGHTIDEANEIIADVVDFSELGDFINLPVQTYSSGMMLRLMFSIATARMPDIFLLDEMFSTGDSEFQKKSSQRVHEIIENAKIFIFASHDMSLVKKYCNRIFSIEHGRVSELV